jgi:hypothetical protein
MVIARPKAEATANPQTENRQSEIANLFARHSAIGSVGCRTGSSGPLQLVSRFSDVPRSPSLLAITVLAANYNSKPAILNYFPRYKA